MRVALVACSSIKLEKAAAARDLYTSPLFKKSREWAERYCDDWWVLSAKHGLVRPEAFLNPYSLSLKDKTLEEREDWRKDVGQALADEYPQGATFVWLAGGLYMGALRFIPYPNDYDHEEPMKGMQIGKRLRWLNMQLTAQDPSTRKR